MFLELFRGLLELWEKEGSRSENIKMASHSTSAGKLILSRPPKLATLTIITVENHLSLEVECIGGVAVSL